MSIKVSSNDWLEYPIKVINGLITTERGIPTSITHQGLKDLCELVTDKDTGTAIEIGAYAGEGTVILAERFERVITIDPWINGYDNEDASSHMFNMDDVKKSFLKRIEPFDNIIPISGTSADALGMFEDNSIELVYIDAIHRCGPVKNEIWNWLRKVKNDGIIGGHDFCGYWGEVVDAVIDTIGLPEDIFKDKSWIKSKESIIYHENINTPELADMYLKGEGERPR